MFALFILLAAFVNSALSVWAITSMPASYSVMWLLTDLFVVASAAFVGGVELGRRTFR